MKNSISEYTKGKGIDVSKGRALSKSPDITHFYQEPDNQYSLKSVAKYESLDFIYSNNIINETKFHRILLKEWFYFCKVHGYIIIEMHDNDLLSFQQLIDECSLLFSGKASIIHKEYDESGKSILIIEKHKPALHILDSISKWSFGILSDGKRQEWVDGEIESILALQVPLYEVIICGAYEGKYKNDVKVIPFQAEKEKISAHKNLICESAKYENIVLTHDKFIFDKKWYEGMKKYGNYFDVLSCIIQDEQGKRAGDWITYGNTWNALPRFGLLDYKDWDKHGYIDGGFYILKKEAWRKVQWDSSLSWNQGEDIKLSKEWYNTGIVARFNTISKCITRVWRHGDWSLYSFNSRELGSTQFRGLAFYWWLFKQGIKKNILKKD